MRPRRFPRKPIHRARLVGDRIPETITLAAPAVVFGNRYLRVSIENSLREMDRLKREMRGERPCTCKCHKETDGA